MIRRRAAVWAIVAAALIAACATLLFAGRAPVQTDLLALLPATERNPAVERAVAGLAEAGARRSVFLIGHSASDRARLLADRFAQALSAADVFSTVRVDFPAPDAAILRDLYAPHRFQLLSADDREALAAVSGREFIEQRLQRRLYDPFHRGLGTPLEQDPLGVFDAWLASLPAAQAGAALEFDEGRLSVRDGELTYIVVLAELGGPAYDGALQQRLRTVLAGAEGAVHEIDDKATILRTGMVHYASAGRQLAERDLRIIGIGSIAGISILLFSVFRSFLPIALGIFSVGVGVCAAILATVGIFGEVHIITLVFGASLTGEAVDYSIQYFAARLHAGGQWEARRGLRMVLPGVAVAVLTSILGYGALALTPFPALRQIALFAVVGLVVACLTVALLLPAFLQTPVRRQPRALLRGASDGLSRIQRLATVRVRVAILALLAVVSLPGWLQVTAQDDIRLLVNPPADLQTQEVAIRRLTGLAQSGQFFVVQGADRQELLAREERLTERLRELRRRGALQRYQAVSDFVPSEARQRENRAWWREKIFSPPGTWQQVLTAYGFRQDIAARHARDFARAQAAPLTLDSWLQSPLSAPFRHLWIGASGAGYVSIVMPVDFESVAVLAQSADGLAGVTLVDKAGSVSRLFRDYRFMGAIALLLAALLVFAVLCVRYGQRHAWQGLLPTAAGIGVVLAWAGYVGAPLTLFSVMALLLVLGVSVNYVIFLREGAERRGAALVGVLLSAATTVLSFGLLAWSSTPALAQFGSTLFIGVAVTVALAPFLVPLGERGGCG